MTTASEYARILTELHSQFLHEFANWQHHQYFVKKYEKELEDLKNTDPELLSPLDKINLQCSPQWIKREETSRDHCREKNEFSPASLPSNNEFASSRRRNRKRSRR